jgi:hypothetical protein
MTAPDPPDWLHYCFVVMIIGATLLLIALSAKAEEKSKLLVSVRIDPRENTLSWTIADGSWEGKGKDREFFPSQFHEYKISIDEATMTDGDQTRDVSRHAAHSIRDLRDALVGIASDFTVEWRDGLELDRQEKDAPKPAAVVKQ